MLPHDNVRDVLNMIGGAPPRLRIVGRRSAVIATLFGDPVQDPLFGVTGKSLMGGLSPEVKKLLGRRPEVARAIERDLDDKLMWMSYFPKQNPGKVEVFRDQLKRDVDLINTNLKENPGWLLQSNAEPANPALPGRASGPQIAPASAGDPCLLVMVQATQPHAHFALAGHGWRARVCCHHSRAWARFL